LAALPAVISPEERDALMKARSDVLALTEAADKMLNRCIAGPVAGSELDSCLLKNPDGWWLMYSHSSLYVAIDHLTALVALWAAPAIPHSAGYTVIRGAAEGAARACWLVDPSLTSRERIARGIVEHAYALDCMRRVEGDSEQIRIRRRAFEMTLLRAGFAVDGRVCENEARPRIATLMHQLLSAPIASGSAGTVGGLAYALLSGFAHAEPWATLMDMQRVDSRVAVMTLNPLLQVQVLRLAMRLLVLGVCWTVGLAGFDVEAWKQEAVPLFRGF
jgi:hypothetical protein